MNKKGFTLIEIIISVALVLIIGTSATFVVINNDKNEDLNLVTNKILEAANVYFNIEKDSEGNSFTKKILNGAKGVKIPVSNLVNKGYLDENIQNDLYNLTGDLEDDTDYYVMFVEDNQACEEGYIKELASWMEKGKDIYLCNPIEVNKLIESILENYDESSIEVKDDVTNNDYYVGGYSHLSPRSYFSVQNGLFKKSDGTKYFRGVVGNNYVSINDEIFRILSFNDSEIKLIKEKAIDESFYTNATGSVHQQQSSSYYVAIEYKDSKFHNALKSWFEAFINDFDSNTDKDTSLIFKSFDHCTKKISTDECIDEALNEKYSLPNVKDMFFSGVPTYTVSSSSCNSFHSTSCQGAWAAFNWMVLGDSTIMLDRYDNEAYYYGFSNYTMDIGEVDYMAYGVIVSVEITKYIESSLKYIRPVVVLDNSKITFTGKGTVDSPYVIEPNY